MGFVVVVVVVVLFVFRFSLKKELVHVTSSYISASVWHLKKLTFS